MIQRIPKHPGYGKYFLASEAPGDPPLRRNMKVITVNPSRRARLDFTNDLVVPDEPELDLPDVEEPDGNVDLDLPDIDDEEVSVGTSSDDNDDLGLDLPDIEPTQTQNVPDQDSNADSSDLDLPEIEPSGSSDDNLDLPEIEPEDTPVPNQDLNLPEIDDEEEPDMELDLPDVEEPTFTPPDLDLPEVDDEVQSTNIPVNPADSSDGDTTDYTNTNDEVQSTNVAVNPGETDQSEPDFTADTNNLDLPQVDGQDTTSTPPADANADADNTDYTQDDTSAPADGQSTPDQGNGDDIDFTDTGDDGATDDQAPSEDTTQDNSDNQKRGPGLEYDSVRKYNLYKEFARLRMAIDSYITKLESCISDDPESNHVIKICTTKFREMYDLITDYMMMKFELCTYIQNLLFYQRQITTVHLIFKLLKEVNRVQKSDEKKDNGKRK